MNQFSNRFKSFTEQCNRKLLNITKKRKKRKKKKKKKTMEGKNLERLRDRQSKNSLGKT